MKTLFTKASTLSHGQRITVLQMTGALMLLVLASVFVADNSSMGRLNHILAKAGITKESQTGCVFPCNNTAYQMQQLVSMTSNNGTQVTNVAPGATVYWQWIVSAYGANNFTTLCQGANAGPNYVCTVAQDAPNYNFAQCSPSTYVCTSQSSSCDKSGCSSSCSAGYWTTPSGCGNADAYYGDTCFGSTGTIPPNYSCPGYHGNVFGTTPLTAPSTPGTYNYYLCSNYMLHAPAYNSALTALPCTVAQLTVVAPPTCSISPTSQTINQNQSASWTYSTTGATSVAYAMDGVNKGAPPGNPYTYAGSLLSVGSHNMIMTVTNSVGVTATCGTNGDLTVTAAPTPSCTLTPATQTVPVGGAPVLSYTSANNTITPTYKVDGGAAVTVPASTFNIPNLAAGAHSVVMTVTNAVGGTNTCNASVTIGALTPSATITASPTTVVGGGTSAITWSSQGVTANSCTLSASPSSVGSGANTPVTLSSAGTLPAGASLGLNTPIIIGNTIYRFGGYTGSAYTSAISSAPLSNPTSWSNVGNIAAANYAPSIAVIGNYIYLFGGNNGSAVVNTIQRAPISSPTSWSVVGTLPVANAWGTLAIIGDFVYIFGGNNGSAWSNVILRAQLSDPVNSWTNAGTIATGYSGLGAALVTGGYVYLVGGYGSGAYWATISRAAVSNPLSWTNVGSLPASIGAFGGLAVVGNTAYIYGGYNGASYVANIYSAPLSNPLSWSSAGTIPSGGPVATTPIIAGTKLYLFGGLCPSTQAWCSSIYSAPVNTGLPLTSYTMPLHEVDGGANTGITWPLTQTTQYTASCSSGSVSQSVNVLVDQCANDASFPGVQSTVPPNCVSNNYVCSAATGYIVQGGACVWDGGVFTTPVTAAPARVRKGGTTSVSWATTKMTSCTLTYVDDQHLTPQTLSTATSGSVPQTITSFTTDTLTCTDVYNNVLTSKSVINVIPVLQEI